LLIDSKLNDWLLYARHWILDEDYSQHPAVIHQHPASVVFTKIEQKKVGTWFRGFAWEFAGFLGKPF
jgi:hypothetical protein